MHLAGNIEERILEVWTKKSGVRSWSDGQTGSGYRTEWTKALKKDTGTGLLILSEVC